MNRLITSLLALLFQICFFSAHGQWQQIFYNDLTPNQVANIDFYDRNHGLAWKPDSNKIYYTSNGGLNWINAYTFPNQAYQKQVRLVGKNRAWLSWSENSPGSSDPFYHGVRSLSPGSWAINAISGDPETMVSDFVMYDSLTFIYRITSYSGTTSGTYRISLVSSGPTALYSNPFCEIYDGISDTCSLQGFAVSPNYTYFMRDYRLCRATGLGIYDYKQLANNLGHRKVYAVNDSLVFLTGNGSDLSCSKDSGKTIAFTIPMGSSFTRNLAFFRPDTGYATFYTELKKTTDGGLTWFPVGVPGMAGIRAMVKAQDGSLFVLDDTKKLFVNRNFRDDGFIPTAIRPWEEENEFRILYSGPDSDITLQSFRQVPRSISIFDSKGIHQGTDYPTAPGHKLKTRHLAKGIYSLTVDFGDRLERGRFIKY